MSYAGKFLGRYVGPYLGAIGGAGGAGSDLPHFPDVARRSRTMDFCMWAFGGGVIR